MEYLMTYGWAILIVIVVAGVLAYYGVFSPGKLVGPTKTGFGMVDVLAPWSVNSGGQLTLRVENRVGEEINVTNIYGKGTSNLQATVLAAGKNAILTASNSGFGSGGTGDSFTLTVSIEYELTSAKGTRFNSTGTISGTRS